MLNKLIEDYKVIRQEFNSKMKTGLVEATKELFDKIPELNVIKWTQYAPYFNDGDACVFSVHEPSFSNAKDSEDVGSEEYFGDEPNEWVISGWAEKKLKSTLGEESSKLLLEFSEAIQSNEMSDFMEDSFGDGVEVTLVRGKDEAIVSEYNHD